MSEKQAKARRAGLADFARRSYEFEVITPDGETLVIQVRDVTADQLFEATRDMKLPEPPAKKGAPLVKDQDGKITVPLDYDSPLYLHALMDFRQRQMAAHIVTVWETDDLTGTLEEKIEQVIALPNWAFNALSKVCNLITTTSEDRIKRRSFRSDGVVETQDS